ncbi:MAG: UDP-glucose/GDP-mannose dehydrogenase family protein [Bacilli bacterium]|nr:UDP-glucose/GDP-mannose dehydrogenase family protein [Bacilli bacterium]
MKIVVTGVGYVGLVTGVSFAEMGYNVICVDNCQKKIELLRAGKSPIHEDGLEELMDKHKNKIVYTSDYQTAYSNADVIFIGVGTPENIDGTANLKYIHEVINQILENIKKDLLIVIKSTVPVGTNDQIEYHLKQKLSNKVNVNIVSNPEFLSQGTAVKNALCPSRIIIGLESKEAEKIMRKIYRPLTDKNIPLIIMNRKSAEMTKYASNSFLALKISYINEIANLCEKVGADIEEVSNGMGLDPRIGNKFLRAGIGYGGSCFPKDTKALYMLSKKTNCILKTIKASIDINKKQRLKIVEMVKKDFNNNLKGKEIVVLGLSFKPNTDDLREAPSIEIVKKLIKYGAKITVYDLASIENFKKIFKNKIKYEKEIIKAIKDKDIALIVTEWQEIVDFELKNYEKYMKTPIIYDGRNCYNKIEINKTDIKYKSIGRIW